MRRASWRQGRRQETLPWPGRGAELLVGEAAVHPPRERGNNRTRDGTLLHDVSQSCRGTISEAFSASFPSPRRPCRGEAFLPEAGPGLRKARRKRAPPPQRGGKSRSAGSRHGCTESVLRTRFVHAMRHLRPRKAWGCPSLPTVRLFADMYG